MRHWRWLGVILVVILLGAVTQLLFGNEAIAVRVSGPQATATIGSGEEAIAVSAGGILLPGLPVSEDAGLPALPTIEPPKSGFLAGPMLQQALVLGAAPAALRPYVERSYYGESGVDVILDAGVELRFGDASQAVRKWQAAAAVLADPTISRLDYVDLHAPSRPAYDGEGHELPALP